MFLPMLLKVCFKLHLMIFASTMQEKIVDYAFQISQENKFEDQLLTIWTRWKNMEKEKISAGPYYLMFTLLQIFVVLTVS